MSTKKIQLIGSIGNADFVVAVTKNDDSTYIADKTYQEIQNAYENGQSCVCNLDDTLLLPLVLNEGSVFYFIAVSHGYEYHVEFVNRDTDCIAVEVTELGGGEVFTVTYTDNEDEYQRIDKTFEEIRAAIDNGMVVQCVQRDGPYVQVLTLGVHSNNSIFFSASGAEDVWQIVIYSDGRARLDVMPYVFPVATAGKFGGVRPVAKTEGMTQSVGVDATGRLWTTTLEISGGLTTAQAMALDGMFKIAAYTADASDAYAAFRKAFGLDDSGGGDNDGGDTGDDTHAHSYASSVTKEATCETDGVRTYTCACGNSYTEQIPATGHNYVDGVCTVCGLADSDVETEATLSSISATYSGGEVSVGTAVSALTGIVVTATYSDGSTTIVTDYTLSGTISDGENTITVSYGGKTTTFTVSGVTGTTETTEPVYRLAEAITFTKDKVVDTGYKLLDVDKSWSVCVDHNDVARGGTVWDASPNNSQGLTLSNRGNYYRTLLIASSTYKDIGNVIGNYKTIVTHTKNTNVVNYHFVLPGTTNLVTGEIPYTKYLTDGNIISANARTVKIGGRYDGTTADYNGTINRFEIYERVLSEAEIYAFTGAEVHEGVTDYVTIPCVVPTDNIVAGEINDAGAIAEKTHAYVADSYIKVTAGNSYVVDATELFAAQTYDTQVECAWYDRSGIYISQVNNTLTTRVKAVTITALDNAEYMKVGIACNTATADNIGNYFDCISIEEVE